MSARRDWTHSSPVLRGACNDNAPATEPHALRVVVLLTLGFWAVVGVSCAAWVVA